jgi:hypothetical protein
MEEFKGLADVLAWITGSGGGSFLIVTWLVSWALEKVAWWDKLNSKVKSTLIVVLAGVLGVGSQVLLLNPDLVAVIDPYFKPVMYIAITWLTSQIAHAKDPSRAKEVKVTNYTSNFS